MVNNPLIRPYFLGGGGIGVAPLDSHDFLWIWPPSQDAIVVNEGLGWDSLLKM